MRKPSPYGSVANPGNFLLGWLNPTKRKKLSQIVSISTDSLDRIISLYLKIF
jgi:hypothetical protein